MADIINLQKRLIGKEDINFDISGSGARADFYSSEGKKYTLTKINASHIPLTAATRQETAAANVDKALANFAEKIKNYTPGDVLTKNVTVNFEATDTVAMIQDKINAQKKNLNGYTITFRFPESLDQNLYNTIAWQKFYNGTIIISGGSEENKVTIYDQLDITSLFKIYQCQCTVGIQYFHFVHQYTRYAIMAENSSAVLINKCTFSGMGQKESYAVYNLASNAVLVNCETSEDKDYFHPFTPEYLPCSGGTMTGDIKFNQTNDLKFSSISGNDNEQIIGINSGSRFIDGGYIRCYGINSFELDNDNNAGGVSIGASNGASVVTVLRIQNNGEATINGKQIFTTAGGVVDGGVTFKSNIAFNTGEDNFAYLYPLDNKSIIGINGGSSIYKGGFIRVYGIDEEKNNIPGGVGLYASDGTQVVNSFIVKKDGTATINGKYVLCVESWRSGANWYRKYADGWIEQGGITTVGIGFTTVTLPMAFSNNNYTLVASSAFVVEAKDFESPTISLKTATNFRARWYEIDYTRGTLNWYACGY